MSAVWRFEYSVKQRVEALRDILVQGESESESASPSRVRKEWTYRAQLVLEPCGWSAYWKLTRETCQLYGVRYPCVVYVNVVNLDLNEEELRAEVEVVGVQDDSVHLPERSWAPIEQLWATLAQSNDAIQAGPTAEFIDHYRYFYQLIWMPWDLEDDEQDNWFELHVPLRCQMWASAEDPEALRALRDDGEIVRRRIVQIEESLTSDGEDSAESNSNNVSALLTLHEQLQALRAKWELLQNPALQNLLRDSSPRCERSQSDIILVWNGGPLKDYARCLRAAEDWLKVKGADPNKNVGCSPSLIAAFEPKPKRSSAILLCEGLHALPRNFSFGEDRTIASVLSHRSVLKCPEPCASAISVTGSAELSGLAIEPGFANVGLTVRSGALRLESCSLTGSSDLQTQAIMVFNGGKLICEKCTIGGFFTGIIAQKGSNIILNNCIMEDCGVMLQAYEGARVHLNSCTFKNHAEAAIRYETTRAAAASIGGTNILNSYEDIVLKNCTFTGEGKNDVYVTHLDELACPQLEGTATSI